MENKTIKEVEDSKYKVPISKLKFRENWNYKNITRTSIDQIKDSLLENEDGQLMPILCNAETNSIIGGHHQYIAIKELIEEGKWKFSDLVWIEPRYIKDPKHEKILALKHNTQFDIAMKERIAEWGAELIDTEYNLANIPVLTDLQPLTLIEAVAFVSPSKDSEVEESATSFNEERNTQEVKCPECGAIFDGRKFKYDKTEL